MRRLSHFLPVTAKLYLRVWQRRCADICSGQHRLLAARSQQPLANDLSTAITVQQAIMGGDAAANKIQNIQMAIRCLQGLVVQPGQTFSFWHLVGQPSAGKGYQKSRSIVQGKVVAETGGGLCQLSGLLYLLALKAGLTVIERHAHSVDIYQEAERFAPLGSDATVAFGYKDLRFANNLPHPIMLQFSITPTGLSGSIASPQPLAEREISFSYAWQSHSVAVTTLVNGCVIGSNSYTRLYPDNL